MDETTRLGCGYIERRVTGVEGEDNILEDPVHERGNGGEEWKEEAEAGLKGMVGGGGRSSPEQLERLKGVEAGNKEFKPFGSVLLLGHERVMEKRGGNAVGEKGNTRHA